jgi:hypothetical protein
MINNHPVRQSTPTGIYHRVSHTVDWILENLD